jgi:hypothetical protein
MVGLNGDMRFEIRENRLAIRGQYLNCSRKGQAKDSRIASTSMGFRSREGGQGTLVRFG